MEQLRADLQRVQEEFKNLKSTTTSFFTQLRLHTTRETGRPQPRSSSTKPVSQPAVNVERLLDVYSQFERRLEEFDKQIENALASANQSATNISPSAASRDSSISSDTIADTASRDTSSIPELPITSHNTDTASRGTGSVPDTASRDIGSVPELPSASRDTGSVPKLPSIPNTASGDTTSSACPLLATSLSAGGDTSPSVRTNPAACDIADLPLAARDTSLDDSLKTSTVFCLRLLDLGDHLIRRLQTFVQDDNFAGKLLVEDAGFASPLPEVQPSEESEFATHFEIGHRLQNDIWRLDSHPVSELQLPDLSNVTKPSDSPEEYLENLYKKLPEGPVPYYIGPLLGPTAEKLQSYFPSGDAVCQLGHVPGISSLYGHIGEKGSGTPFHCEDANLRSYNLTLVGWKIWILVKPCHTANFENLVQRLTNCDDGCDQFVRHAAVVIHPSKLREEKIEFDIICSGPGEMVLTQPRQYHAVINFTASFAIATNFVLPDENPIPNRLSVCNQDGLYRLEHQMISKLRSARRKSNRQLEAPQRRKRPRFSGPSELSVVQVLVQATTSRNAILRFMAVVCAWRRVNDDVRGQLFQIDKSNGSLRLKALDTLRMAFQKRSQLFSFLEVLTSIQLVRSLERHITVIAPEAIDRLVEIRGLLPSPQSRRSIRNELTSYQKWDQLCGETASYIYDGILCFVPPVFKEYQDISRTQVERLSKNGIASFRSKLQEVNYVQRLCEVGQAFQMGILGSAEFQERPFETHGGLSTLCLEDLLRLL